MRGRHNNCWNSESCKIERNYLKGTAPHCTLCSVVPLVYGKNADALSCVAGYGALEWKNSEKVVGMKHKKQHYFWCCGQKMSQWRRKILCFRGNKFFAVGVMNKLFLWGKRTTSARKTIIYELTKNYYLIDFDFEIFLIRLCGFRNRKGVFRESMINIVHPRICVWGCVSRWFGRALAWHARGSPWSESAR